MGTDQTQNSENDKKRAKRLYGVKLPVLTFEESIKIIEELGKKAGHTGVLDAISNITGNSTASSTFQNKVFNLKTLGLITTEKNNYTFTDLGNNISFPESAEVRTQSIFDAFLRQETIRKIFENYKGKRLPQIEYLKNYVEKDLRIPSEFCEGWAVYFVESGKFAGILEEREQGSYQVLNSVFIHKGKPLYNTKETIMAEGVATAPMKQQAKSDPLGIEGEQWGIINKKYISGNRKVIFAIPDGLTDRDIEAISTVLDGIKIQLSGLKRFEEE